MDEPRSVLVTGATSGIGQATALLLAEHGYQVFASARGRDKADRLVAMAAERGTTVHPVLFDVADAEATESGLAEVAELTGGGPWAVVNNAGFALSGAIEDVNDDDARYQLEVNLVAPMRIAKLVLPAMRARGDGRILNVSSIAGRVSTPMTGWYCASKHGLEAATDALRMEVEPFGVRVSLVEPGGFGTGIWAEGQRRLPVTGGGRAEGTADGTADASDGPYAAAYRRAHGATGRASSVLPDPVWVARVIRLALASPRPLPRYLVGFDAVGMAVGDTLAPTVVSDYVKTLGAGLRRLPGAGLRDFVASRLH